MATKMSHSIVLISLVVMLLATVEGRAQNGVARRLLQTAPLVAAAPLGNAMQQPAAEVRMEPQLLDNPILSTTISTDPATALPGDTPPVIPANSTPPATSLPAATPTETLAAADFPTAVPASNATTLMASTDATTPTADASTNAPAELPVDTAVPAADPATNAPAVIPPNALAVDSVDTAAALPASNGPADNAVLVADPATNAPADNAVLAADPASNAPEDNAVLAADPATNAPAAAPADNSTTAALPASNAPAATQSTNLLPATPAAHEGDSHLVVGHALKDLAVVPADNAAAAAPANNTVVMPDPAATNIPAAAPADNAAADNTVLAAVPATNAPADNTVLAADPETNAPANNTVLAATNTPAPPALHELFQSWENATVCAGSPTKRTSVQDLDGRLWWVLTSGADWTSCAYRAADGSPVSYDGYVQVKWESSPACVETPTMVNSVADANSRLWSWQEGSEGEGQNCKFVKADGAAVLKSEIYLI